MKMVEFFQKSSPCRVNLFLKSRHFLPYLRPWAGNWGQPTTAFSDVQRTEFCAGKRRDRVTCGTRILAALTWKNSRPATSVYRRGKYPWSLTLRIFIRPQIVLGPACWLDPETLYLPTG